MLVHPGEVVRRDWREHGGVMGGESSTKSVDMGWVWCVEEGRGEIRTRQRPFKSNPSCKRNGASEMVQRLVYYKKEEGCVCANNTPIIKYQHRLYLILNLCKFTTGIHM